MPYLTIDTNANTEISAEILDKAADLISDVLGKPKEYIVVKINANVPMIFGGNTDNVGALVEMKSIGFGNKKADLAQRLTEFAEKYLKANGRYVCIHFLNMDFSDAAQNGRLFG